MFYTNDWAFFPFRHNYWVISLFCRYKQAEVQFLKDYIHVMKPVAQSLDILQGEKNHSNAYIYGLSCANDITSERKTT